MLNQLQRGYEPALLPCRRSGFSQEALTSFLTRVQSLRLLNEVKTAPIRYARP